MKPRSAALSLVSCCDSGYDSEEWEYVNEDDNDQEDDEEWEYFDDVSPFEACATRKDSLCLMHLQQKSSE